MWRACDDKAKVSVGDYGDWPTETHALVSCGIYKEGVAVVGSCVCPLQVCSIPADCPSGRTGVK